MRRGRNIIQTEKGESQYKEMVDYVDRIVAWTRTRTHKLTQQDIITTR